MRSRIVLALLVLVVLPSNNIALAKDRAPLPEEIGKGKTVYILNDEPEPKVLDAAYVFLKKWGKYKIVQSRDSADLVLMFTAKQEYWYSTGIGSAGVNQSGTYGIGSATSTSVNINRHFLIVTDRISGETLWADQQPAYVKTAGGCVKALLKRLQERVDAK
jgi:hypothetical protein